VTSYFLRLLGKERPGTIIFLSSGLGLITLPGSSGYSITKLSDLQLASYTAAENENVTAVAFHPGIVDTDMTSDFWKPYALDTPELAGAVAVWLSTPASRFLNGRYTTTNWDVEELMQRQEEIVQKGLLKVKLGGGFATGEYVQEADGFGLRIQPVMNHPLRRKCSC
jgi:NAD(P)-dependent dehydrogenase (short-subunit alcohol dehydrogenase family)